MTVPRTHPKPLEPWALELLRQDQAGDDPRTQRSSPSSSRCCGHCPIPSGLPTWRAGFSNTWPSRSRDPASFAPCSVRRAT